MTNEIIQFDIRAYNRVANKLRRLASDGAEILDQTVEDFTKQQRREFKSRPYPAKRPGQTYVRTGQTANKWAAEKLAPANWQLVNRRKAIQYIVGDDQAWMHKNRWYVASVEAKKEFPKLTKALTERIEEIWNE